MQPAMWRSVGNTNSVFVNRPLLHMACRYHARALADPGPGALEALLAVDPGAAATADAQGWFTMYHLCHGAAEAASALSARADDPAREAGLVACAARLIAACPGAAGWHSTNKFTPPGLLLYSVLTTPCESATACTAVSSRY